MGAVVLPAEDGLIAVGQACDTTDGDIVLRPAKGDIIAVPVEGGGGVTPTEGGR